MTSVAVQAQSYQDFQRYLSAAKSGDRVAQFYVGMIYGTGKAGVKKDYQQAVYWYRKAADQGQMDAQNNLGVLYYYGLDVTQDYSQAVYWYRKAADQGQIDAQAGLGFLYYYGEGVTQDYSQAVYWSRKAADQGNVNSMYLLGKIYYKGLGVARDLKQQRIGMRNLQKEGIWMHNMQ